MKRVLALLILMTICFSTQLSLSVAADSANEVGEIWSCDFEGDSYKAWYANGGGWGGTYCSITTTQSEVYAGSTAAKITYDSLSGSAYIAVQKSIEGGCTYKVSAYIRSEVASGPGFKVEVLYGIGSANSNQIGGTQTDTYMVTNNQYTNIAVEFTAPNAADVIMIRPRLYGIGTVFVDNVILEKTKGPEPYTITTSHVFHYKGQTEGSATVSLHPYYSETSEEAQNTAVFTITDGSVTVQQKVISFVDHKAVFTYEVAKVLTQMQKRFDFTIEVKNKSGTVLKRKNQGLYLYERPSRLSADGTYVVNGKVLNPVFSYHTDLPVPTTADSDNAYLQAKKAGINLVPISMGNCRYNMLDRVKNALTQLDKYDMYGVFCLYSNTTDSSGHIIPLSAGHASQRSNTENMVEWITGKKDAAEYDGDWAIWKDKAARVFGWMLMDEPLGGGSFGEDRLDELEWGYHAVRQRDPQRPIWCVDYNKAYYTEDVKYCDIFLPDIYTTTQNDVYEGTLLAKEAAERAGKPVYTIVKAFKSASNNAFITPDQLHHVVYQAILGGSRGVGFYSFSDCIEKSISPTGKNIPINETELWPMMLQFKEELPALFEAAVGKSFTETKTADYILREYPNNKVVILPLCAQSCNVNITTDTGLDVLSGNASLLTKKGEGAYTAALGAYTPMFFSREHALLVSRIGNAVTATCSLKGVDLYLATYTALSNGYKLTKIELKKNTSDALTVTVQPDDTRVSAFAFEVGTITPLLPNKTLGT